MSFFGMPKWSNPYLILVSYFMLKRFWLCLPPDCQSGLCQAMCVMCMCTRWFLADNSSSTGGERQHGWQHRRFQWCIWHAAIRPLFDNFNSRTVTASSCKQALTAGTFQQGNLPLLLECTHHRPNMTENLGQKLRKSSAHGCHWICC